MNQQVAGTGRADDGEPVNSEAEDKEQRRIRLQKERAAQRQAARMMAKRRGPDAEDEPEAGIFSDADAKEAGFPPIDMDPSVLSWRFYELDRQLMRMGKRLTQLTDRIAAIQTTVVSRMGQATCELGEPGAEIFPVERRRAPESPVRVIAFGSMGADFGVTPKQFFQALEPHDCDIIFVKDFFQSWYHRGLMGLTRDIDETADYLRRLVAEDGRPVSMVGASSGGFAAILFGLLLGAQRVVAFSPQTEVTEKVFLRFRNDDSRKEDLDFRGRHADLARVAALHPPQGRISIYHSARSEYDAAHARHLDGIEGIELEPLDWHGHNTAKHLKDLGRLDGIMADLARVHG